MPSRLVTYYNNNSIPFSVLPHSSYTNVIIGFLIPSGPKNLTLQLDAGEPPNFANDVRALQHAGKNVLVSLGGSAFNSAAYQQYAKQVPELVQQLVGFVTRNGLNGVDIDYEDDAGFSGTYDGVGFLIALTGGLAQHLPARQNLITHAPQTPYWSPSYLNGPYARIWKEAGRHITWINNQFYNNPDFDATPALKIEWYEKIAAITGATKLMMGALVGDVGKGFLPVGELVSQVVDLLDERFGTDFGGVMGWEFSLDKDGSWANTVWSQIGPPQPGG
jgi:chitinase